MLVFFRRCSRSLLIGAHLIDGALLSVLWLVPLRFVRPQFAECQRSLLVRWWMRFLLRIMGGKIDRQGEVLDGPVLLVANHISWLDIPLLFACTEGLFVAKQEVRRWPVIGFLARHIGTVFLERGRSGATTSREMTVALARGVRVVLFPEGTSTDGRRIRPFYARLYQAAIDAPARVQAVAISYPHADGAHPHVPFVGDDSLLAHLWRLLGHATIEARVDFCRPLAVTGVQRSDLAVRSRNQIVAALNASGADGVRRSIAVKTRSRPRQDAFIHSNDIGSPDTEAAAPWRAAARRRKPEPGASSLMRSTRP